ncbi:hypothetical protein [Terasakiella sp.]|uniref:hypothetical protein n=1 Tax=Terasakiella sp. TaxID=2034861 RepID=UPI003AA974B4
MGTARITQNWRKEDSKVTSSEKQQLPYPEWKSRLVDELRTFCPNWTPEDIENFVKSSGDEYDEGLTPKQAMILGFTD